MSAIDQTLADKGIKKRTKGDVNAYWRRYYAKNKDSILPRNRVHARLSHARQKARKAAQKAAPQ